MTDKQLRIIRRDCEEIGSDLSKRISDFKNASILITGGTGFVGTWLTEILIFLNDEFSFKTKIYLLSRHAYNFKNQVPHLATRPDVTLISNDISNVYELPENINYIIHAAGSPDNRLNASDPIRVTRTIVNGTTSLLDTASRLSELNKILNISSASVYGPQPCDLKNISEDYKGGPDINTAMSAYAEGKRMAEVICSIYRTQYRMNIVTVRPFAFIGPYQLLDRPWAINSFISDALNGGPIKILGDGLTVRSYMYPSDMVNWILNILVNGKPGSVHNIGSTEEINLIGLAEKIASFFPQKIEIQSNIAPIPNKISRLVPDVSNVETNLNLHQKVMLDDALLRSIEWFKEAKQREDDVKTK